MAIKFSNLASTTLASGVSSTATSVSVTSASSFPTLGSGDYFYATIGAGSGSEIVKVTGISGTTFTVSRGEDGTTAVSHSAGVDVALRVTAGTLEDLRDGGQVYTAGSGLGLSGNEFTNTAPDQTVSISGSGSTTVTGTYPSFTVSSTSYSHPSAHPISFITGLQTALDGKVDDSQVLTDVPANALFTDTVYTHPTNHSISFITGLQAALNGKVDDSQVLTNVPSGALFTDTVYTLPFTDNSTNWNTAYGWGDHSTGGYLTSHQSLSGYATETYVGTQISNLVDSSPAALNTLNELAAALGDDPNFATTVSTSIGTKLPLAGGTLTGALSGTTATFSGSVTAPSIRSSSGDFHVNRSSDGASAIRVDADGVVVIPSNYFYVPASQGSYFSSAVRFRGTISNDTGTDVTIGDTLNVTGGIKLNGTTVIDASRNLTNIGTITTSGVVVISGDGGTNDPLSTLRVNSTVNHGGLVMDAPTNKQTHVRFLENGALKWQLRKPPAIDELRFYSWTRADDTFKLDASGNATITNGALIFGTTTVIDSSRNITAGNLTPSGYISQGTGQSHYFRGATDANWRIGSDITADTGGLVNSAALQMIVGGGSSPNYGFQIFGHTTPTVPVFEVLPQANAASSITNIRGKLYINNTEVIDNSRNAAFANVTATAAGAANTYAGVIKTVNTSSDQWGHISLGGSATNDITNNYYLIGRGDDVAAREMSFHIPNDGNYGDTTQPKFRFASSGADTLMTITAETGAVYIKGTISSGAITSTGNSTHGGYSSWTGGNGTAGIFMHYNASSSYRGYFDWRTLQLGNNGANNVLFGNTGTGGYGRFYVNSTAINQLGGTSGIHAFSMLATGEVVKEANERFTIKSHSNGWAGGMRMISSNGGTTFQLHPDDNGWMYVDNIWNFNGDIKMGGTTIIDTSRNLTNINAITTAGVAALTRGNGSVGAPNTANHATGTRIELYNASATAWYAIGVENDTMWFNSDNYYRFYTDAVSKVDFDANGVVNAVGGYKVNGTTVIDSNRYIFGSYFNASSGNNENPTIGQIWTQSTGDNYLRKSTPAHFASQLNSHLVRTDGSNPAFVKVPANYTGNLNSVSNAGVYFTEATGSVSNNPFSSSGSFLQFGDAGGVDVRLQFYAKSSLDRIAFRNQWGNGNWGGWHEFWTTQNDGSGSGLDADLLDGRHANEFVEHMDGSRTNATNLNLYLNSGFYNTGSATHPNKPPGASDYAQLIVAKGIDTGLQIYGGYANPTIYVRGWHSSGNTFYDWKTLWNNANDGSGSGLDADLLDGIQGASFLRSDTATTGTTITASDAFRSARWEDNGGTFLFQGGSGSGRARHLNLADTTTDPSSVLDSHNPSGISWGTRSDNNGYYMLGLKGAYNNGYSTYSRMVVGWHTGLEIGANPSYGGTRFFSDSPYVTSTEIMSVGKGDSNVRVTNNLYCYGATETPKVHLNGGNYEGQIVFGAVDSWRCGIRQHDDGDAELRMWAKNVNGRIHIATGYDGQPTYIARPTDGFVVDHNNVGIGAFHSEDPAAKLHVKGETRLAGGSNTNFAYPNLQSYGSSNSAGVLNYHIKFMANNGNANGSISTNYYQTTYATTSDYRAKEDFQPIINATSRLMSLNPVNFQWKDSDMRTDGFLAHEVAEVVSDAVVGEKDAVDEQGNDELQALDQSKLVPLLVKTIQEQQGVIEALEARISALEA
jgi:hypothetical protein